MPGKERRKKLHETLPAHPCAADNRSPTRDVSHVLSLCIEINSFRRCGCVCSHLVLLRQRPALSENYPIGIVVANSLADRSYQSRNAHAFLLLVTLAFVEDDAFCSNNGPPVSRTIERCV